MRQKGKMKHDLFEVSVAVPRSKGTGTVNIPEYGLNGLTFVEGRQGQPYTVKLTNNSAQRVLAVVSIDGVNVVDGQPCAPEARGYVVPAYSTVEVDGWRTSLKEASRFVFENKEKAYAKSASGDVHNCGVIGVKFISEKPKANKILEAFKKQQQQTIVEEHHHHWHYPPPPTWPAKPAWPGTPIWMVDYTCQPTYTTFNTPADSSVAGDSTLYSGNVMRMTPNKSEGRIMCNSVSVPDFSLGTGWGTSVKSEVSETMFERENELCTLLIYYSNAASLEKAGVILSKKTAVTRPAKPALPQAFTGFCKPPVSQ
jgi:hypothetical protein